jgi:hypothetical protein
MNLFIKQNKYAYPYLCQNNKFFSILFVISFSNHINLFRSLSFIKMLTALHLSNFKKILTKYFLISSHNNSFVLNQFKHFLSNSIYKIIKNITSFNIYNKRIILW